MSLLSAVTSVAEECGYQVGSTVISSTDVTTMQLRAIAQRVIAEMGDAYNWPKLWKSGSITLVDGQSTYALPDDFSWYHFDTFWNTADGFECYGPFTPQEYAYLIGSDYSAYTSTLFTIRGISNNQLMVYPTPDSGTAGQVIIFEYASSRYVRPQTWVTGLSVAVGDYCFYNGNYYTATTAGTTGATAPTHTSSTASDGSVTWSYYSGDYRTFRFDSDEPILTQRILEQGMMERFATPKGVTVTPLFESQLATEFAKQRPGRSFSVVHKPRERGRIIFGAAS